jgi:hypothetical protein
MWLNDEEVCVRDEGCSRQQDTEDMDSSHLSQKLEVEPLIPILRSSFFFQYVSDGEFFAEQNDVEGGEGEQGEGKEGEGEEEEEGEGANTITDTTCPEPLVNYYHIAKASERLDEDLCGAVYAIHYHLCETVRILHLPPLAFLRPNEIRKDLALDVTRCMWLNDEEVCVRDEGCSRQQDMKDMDSLHLSQKLDLEPLIPILRSSSFFQYVSDGEFFAVAAIDIKLAQRDAMEKLIERLKKEIAHRDTTLRNQERTLGDQNKFLIFVSSLCISELLIVVWVCMVASKRCARGAKSGACELAMSCAENNVASPVSEVDKQTSAIGSIQVAVAV